MNPPIGKKAARQARRIESARARDATIAEQLTRAQAKGYPLGGCIAALTRSQSTRRSVMILHRVNTLIRQKHAQRKAAQERVPVVGLVGLGRSRDDLLRLNGDLFRGRGSSA